MRGSKRGLRGKTKLPTLANIKGDTVYTTDKDNEQHEIPPHFTIDSNITEGTHHAERRMESTYVQQSGLERLPEGV
jgi:hypothetical protein